MPSEGRQSQSFRTLATALALVFALALPGGCASEGGEGASGSGSGSGSDESYPNLGDVPERPATMTEEQREQLQKGLVADSQQREYTEEVIAFQAEPAEPLPAPMETSAGDAAESDLGGVTMPSAVAPPFSGSQSASPSAPAPAAATTSSAPSAPAVPSTPPVPSTPSVPPAPSSAAAAAAAAQASPTNIPVPPEDPMARATTPPFSGASGTVSPSPAPPTPPAYTPPAVASTSATAAYTPVPDAPAALSGDADTSNLNRAQLDALKPSAPPFSGAAGTAAASTAPTQLTGPTPDIGTPPAATSAPTAAYAAPAATTAYAAPAPSAYAPPPAAVPPPPVGVQEVFQARLEDTLPQSPTAPMLPSGDLEGGDPLTTVVVSSRGVATFEELPVNVPVLEREPVPAAAAGGGRGGTLARRAVPGSSVKVATILFADGSASLRDREKEIVREVYQRYLQSGRKVRVVGHSSSRTRNMDPVRHRMVNFGISAERANAVAMELQRLGVPSEQITVVAAADDMPMYYEVMPSGEAGNRRTEIYLD